jgi:Leucyl-tRNA synthetase
MSLLNEFNDHGYITKKDLETYLLLLNPVAPHITEEMWSNLGMSPSLNKSAWPKYDESKTIDEIIELPIQINGKVRTTINVELNEDENSIREKVFKNDTVVRFIEGKTIIKEIYVPRKIFNIVVK